MRLWDLKTGFELRNLEGHAGAVDAVAASGDGSVAASGGKDGSVRLWRLPP